MTQDGSDNSGGERKGRRVWTRVAALTLLGGVTGAVAWLWMASPELLPLRTIELTGELRHVDATHMRDTLAPLAQDGFLRVDVKAARKALEALPWVYRAGVRRVWPDVLAVEIEEQQALAAWDRGGLVNIHGEIFMPQGGAAQEKLPVFSGVEGLATVMAVRYAELRQQLAPLETDIERLELNSRRAWSLTLANGIQVVLGKNTGPAQIGRLARVYPRVLAPESARIERIDMRYTNGFAVQWKV